ncbi:hypothetical protein OKJ48_24990 [Streptomyces kunmingensis]|uniref:WXG100 family type VII secretion target n=1 Tax=Streptomyces kunmingensis TaxID=68225 RepID=A0ABU6CFK0_9ACTN|nr:hypothetical protein [Streptomyces kunmingensis]MEB3963474.1 hypothetical protein [Streptomyces kunmingensis]
MSASNLFDENRAAQLVDAMQTALDQLRELTQACDAFVGTWVGTGLASELVPHYDCTLTCEEAETLADLTGVYGYADTAENVLSEHAEHDECGDTHHQCPDCTNDDQAAAPKAVTKA